MTVAQSFVKLLESKGYGVFGQNIFLYRVPNSLKTPTELFYIIPSGGSATGVYPDGTKRKLYQFLVYFRSNSAKRVDEVLSAMDDDLNCAGCAKLEGFEMVSLNTSQFPADQDLDSENRMVGLLQVQLEVYKTCKNES